MSYPVFFALYSISMLVGLFVGLLLTVGWKKMDWRKALNSARCNIGYVGIVAGLPLFIQLQGLLEQLLGIQPDPIAKITYTTWIFNISGGSAIRIIQDRLDYRILANLFILVYAWVFSYLLYMTPVLMLTKDDRPVFRKYTIAMAFNYIVLMPFYTMFPVSVTGSFPEAGVTPLLYINTHWGKMVTSVDPLDNDFPSGHVSLVATTLFIIAGAGQEYRRYFHFVLGSTAAVVFAVVYLGIHWPPDIIAGVLVAVAAVWVANNEKVQRTVDRLVSRFTARLTMENVQGGTEESPEPTPDMDSEETIRSSRS